MVSDDRFRSESYVYEKVRVVGVGSYGQAVLCWATLITDSDKRELCVVKQISLSSSLSDREKSESITEVKILSTLRHPMITRIIDSFIYKGCLMIVTEYCDKGDLYKIIEKSKQLNIPIQEDKIILYFIQIVESIRYVHNNLILHRDLKSSNIFVNNIYNIKLGDFGISKKITTSTDLCSTIVGTPQYMSPELLCNKPYHNKSDIWSLGCILYELCALRSPFQAQSLPALALKIYEGKYTPVADTYSSELRNLITILLDPEPTNRPTTDEILSLPWIREHVRKLIPHYSRDIPHLWWILKDYKRINKKKYCMYMCVCVCFEFCVCVYIYV
eukprot:GHVR01014430.1.p1 GENE.GHVR01014430.1~~GHVR01014430.1.p1  ORF type:complete len:330 (-),score=63.73 GHVR01014430.1:25-1014(-)